MRRKILSAIGFMLVFSVLLSTVAMANQGKSGRGCSKHAHYAEIVAKLISATPQEMDKLFAVGYTLEEILIAAGKVEEFQYLLQKYYKDKDKNIIIEIGDQNKKEDGMVVRIIAALDEKTDDKVKVEVVGLGNKIADLEKSKTIVLDSKKGVVDVYVTDGIYQNVLNRHRGHHERDYGMTHDYNSKNNLESTQSSGRQGSRGQGGQAGYQAAPTNKGAAVGNTGGGNMNMQGSPGRGAMGTGGYTPGMGGTGYTPAPRMNTTGTSGYTPGAGMNTTGTTGYTPGAGMNTTGTTGYTPGAGTTRGGVSGATGNVEPTGGYRGTTPVTGAPSRMGANANQGAGMNQTVGVMSSQTETNFPTEARVLGISQAQVKAAVDNGNTIFSLVSAAGKLNEYKDALIADNKAAFDIGIAEGKFDKETADKMRSYFEQKIATWDGTTPIDMFKIKIG